MNKVATAVQLRFDIDHSDLPPGVRARLKKLAGKRVNQDGILLIESMRFRTQGQNRQDAIDRFAQLVRSAAQKPKQRKKTRPSPDTIRRRLEAKRRRSKLKEQRRSIPWE